MTEDIKKVSIITKLQRGMKNQMILKVIEDEFIFANYQFFSRSKIHSINQPILNIAKQPFLITKSKRSK